MPWLIFGLPYAFPASLEQDAALFAAVRWWWRKTASHGREAPFLHVCLNENKTHLPEIHMHCTRAISANRREEVLAFEIVREFVKARAVPGEEDRARPGFVTDTDHVALNVCWSIGCRCEGLVEPSVSG